jgi:L-2,4-diaminobutyric acid acetyltransferase
MSDASEAVDLRAPEVRDGAAMWRLAEASGGLDLNTPYAYLLWCRDFADASVVADAGGSLVGYVTGFRRPSDPSTLFVWQVTTAPEARGRGLAGAMIDSVLDRLGSSVTHLEASVTPDNVASRRTFAGVAERRRAPTSESPLFGGDDFPTPHDPEVLLRIGPFGA